MALPFSELPQHRQTVLKIYRAALRNSVHFRHPSEEVRGKLIDLVRRLFRTQRQVNNSLVCRDLITDAINWSNKLCELDGKSAEELESIAEFQALLERAGVKSKGQKQKPKVTREPKVDEQLQAEAPAETDLAAKLDSALKPGSVFKDESLFKPVPKHGLPGSVVREAVLDQHRLFSWVELYIKRHQQENLLPKKSKLDERYINEVLKSKVLYARNKKVLERVRCKLGRPSTAGLRSGAASLNPLYALVTPWNQTIGNGDIFYVQRMRYSRYLQEHTEFQAYKQKWKWQYEAEQQWESLTSGTRKRQQKDPAWSYVFDYYGKRLAQWSHDIEADTIRHNKKQWCHAKNLAPVFDKLFEDSRANMDRLFKEMKAEQIGPYTDIVGMDLGEEMERHHFRNPSKRKLMERATGKVTSQFSKQT